MAKVVTLLQPGPKEQELMHAHLRTLIATLVCVTAVAGCQSRESAAPGAARPLKVAFVTNNSADFWTIARRGCEQADRELADVEVEFRIPSDGTAAEQRRIVDDLLAKGIGGIAISPVDPVNQTQMINEIARQVLVITQDSDAPQSDRACYLGTDNVAAGRQAGELIKEALPQGGRTPSASIQLALAAFPLLVAANAIPHATDAFPRLAQVVTLPQVAFNAAADRLVHLKYLT